VLRKEGNGQSERSTLNYGNKMRMRARRGGPRGGPRGPTWVATWVKSTWAWHTHETPSSKSYRLTCKSSFTSAMHLSIVGLPPLVGHMYRRVFNKLFFRKRKKDCFRNVSRKFNKISYLVLLINRRPAIITSMERPIFKVMADGVPHPPARRKAILLDVDGVLHPFETGEHFVAGCMEQLRAIVAATGASIYLSSSWQSTEVFRFSSLVDAHRNSHFEHLLGRFVCKSERISGSTLSNSSRKIAPRECD
jgi:hypothetical protein